MSVPARPPIPPEVVDGAVAAWSAAGRRTRLTVEGVSMWPLIRPGDVVEVEHTAAALERGDVVAYRAEQRLVIHRVVRTAPDGGFIVAGDNRTISDAAVPRAAVLGRVHTVESGSRRWSLTTRRARLLGRAIIALHPLKGVPLIGRGLRWLRRLTAGLLRP